MQAMLWHDDYHWTQTWINEKISVPAESGQLSFNQT